MARDHVPDCTGEARSLWLEARLGESTWVFELAPTEDRAIVVGSLLRAHIRIDRKGIFPVHFHFEREGDSVHLVPAYRGDLFVDGIPVSTPKRIEEAGVIDFSGTQLCVRVVADRALLATNTDARGWDEQRALDTEISGGEFSEWADLTLSALPSAGSMESGAETRALKPLCDVHLSKPEPSPPASSLPRVQREDASVYANSEFLPTPVDGVPVAPQLETWFDVPPRGNSNDNAVPGSHATDRAHPNSRPPTVRPLRTATLLVRLGLLASQRPALVSLFASVGAAMLTLALLGVRQCFGTMNRPRVVARDFAATPAPPPTSAPWVPASPPVVIAGEPSNSCSPLRGREPTAPSAEPSRPRNDSRPRKSGKPNAQTRSAH